MIKTEHFVTIFDRAYAAKGLSLLASLEYHMNRPFTLTIYTLDTASYGLLVRATQDNDSAYIVPPWKFLSDDLNSTLPLRSKAEKFFTCTPFIIENVFLKRGCDRVTYLDADTFFFENPDIAFNEMGDKQVAVVDHNFPQRDYQRLIRNGRFNVSWVSFTNKRESLEVLARWRDQCLAKCDKETVGDQLYLNEWPDILGDKLHVFENVGIGLGPWSAYAQDIQYDGEQRIVMNGEPLVMYHFHELKREGTNKYFLTGYPVTRNQNAFIYDPYIEMLEYFEWELMGLENEIGH